MDIKRLKKSINDKFNYLENKVDILALEPITTDNKEQIYGYTANQLLEEIQRLNKEMSYSYVAGFFDGEGTVGLYKAKGYMRLMIYLGNTNFEVLIKMKNLFGGYIYSRNKIENRKKVWDWNIRDRDDIKNFLEKIYPYTTVKRQQIKYALRYLELSKKAHSSNIITQEEHEIRQFFADKIKEMKDTEYNNEDLKKFEEKIKDINKNQPSLMDY